MLWIVIAALLWLVARRWRPLVLTVIAVAVADWSSMGIKALVDRQRPSLHYAEPRPLVHTAHDPSFPSGHAATSFAAATILSLAWPRLAPFLYVLAAAVAFSRVYVGVHYPLDVIGGAALGVVIALALAASVRLRARRRGARARADGG